MSKTKVIGVRLEEDDCDRLNEQATAAGESSAAYAKALVLAGLAARGTIPINRSATPREQAGERQPLPPVGHADPEALMRWRRYRAGWRDGPLAPVVKMDEAQLQPPAGLVGTDVHHVIPNGEEAFAARSLETGETGILITTRYRQGRALCGVVGTFTHRPCQLPVSDDGGPCYLHRGDGHG